ncbi:MAG: autotransporter outer membrane beta-barrel domain-containing protein [Sedimenticolaceae bacterium]
MIGVFASPCVLAYDPTTALGSLGQTELQQRTGDVVQTVCGQLGQLPDRSSLQDDLFDRCGNMVGNASVLTGGGPAEAKSLGWTEDAQVAAVVQTVANEELAATRTMATQLGSGQANIGITRLQSLRRGVRFSAFGNGVSIFEGIADSDTGPRDEQTPYGGAAGDALAGGWGFFVNANYATGDRDRTDREDEFDYDAYGATVGADYRLDDNNIVGGMVGYGNVDADFDSNNNFSTSPGDSPGGKVDADSWGIALYGTHYQENFYIDGLIGYTRTDYDMKRKISLPLGPDPGDSAAAIATNRTARGDTDSDSFTVGVGGGLDLQAGSITYGPFARLTYQETKIDDYKENNAEGLNLTVDDQDWDSLTSTLGGGASYASSQDWGVLIPFARVAWVHEFENDSQKMKAFYTVDPQQNNLVAQTDDPDRDYFELGIGVSAVMRGGLQAFFDYQTLLGYRDLTDHVFTIGIRSEL